MRAPCLNCQRRTVRPNCHGVCKEYKMFMAERERARQRKAEAGEADGNVAQRWERMSRKRWER